MKKRPTSKNSDSIIPADVGNVAAPVTALLENLRAVIHESRQQAFRAVDVIQVRTCWLVGCHIVEFEQGGEARAAYGKSLLAQLSARLTAEFGRGFDASNLRYMRLFYHAFPKCDALRHELSWTHYRTLLRVEEPTAREWYMNEAAAQNWNTRALERQIRRLYYERLLSSQDRDRKALRDEAQEGLASKAPTGRHHHSLGQRPREKSEIKYTALKGRSKPCPNPSHASTSTSFSAPRTASESFPTGFAIRSMLTWPPFCKTLDVLPCSSTLSKTTFTSSLNWPAPSPLVQPWRMSKKRPPNGSRRKAVSSPDSRGRQVMEHLRSPNPTCPPSVNTSQTSGNIIAKNRFRRNTGHFWNGIRSPSMSGMSGIDATIWVALSGLDSLAVAYPGRCPGLAWICPFGAQEGSASKAPTGRHHHSLGQRPRFPTTPPIPAPTGRPNRNGGAA